MHSKEFLKNGPLTEITNTIKVESNKIDGEGIDLLFNIADHVKELFKTFKFIKYSEGEKLIEKEHQKRTATEIIKSKYFFGCSDIGLVFVAIARAKGIPSCYIQTVDIDSFYNQERQIRGHVYSDCYLDEGVFRVDPEGGVLVKLFSDKYKRKIYKFKNIPNSIEVFVGLDNEDAGVKSHGDMIEAMKTVALSHGPFDRL